MTARWRVLACAGAMLAGACRAKSPVETLLADLESRAEDRDAEAVAALLTADFRAPNGLTKAAVADEMKRYFFAYESLDLHISEVVPTGEPPTRVALRVDMEGKAKDIGALSGLVPSLSAWQFELDLVPKDGRLLIGGGRWERIDRTGP